MAHFYGSMWANRGEATRGGSKESGLTVHARGWDFGVRVELSHRDGRDQAVIYRTGGSNGSTQARAVLRLEEGEDETRENVRALVGAAAALGLPDPVGSLRAAFRAREESVEDVDAVYAALDSLKEWETART
jgi:hypothetical protein